MLSLNYCKYYSPLGDIFIGFFGDKIIKIEFGGLTEDDFILNMNKLYPNYRLKKKNVLSLIKRELALYFNSKPVNFKSKVLLLSGTDFQRRVWEQLIKIPYGKLVSYFDVALGIGNYKSVRAVGGAVGSNPIPIIIPCHRVIKKNGDIGGFGSGIEMKKKILQLEGIIFK